MKNKNDLHLILSTIDTTIPRIYYRFNKSLNYEQQLKVRKYFKYYQPKDFKNLDEVAGKTSGWMCKKEDIDHVNKLLNLAPKMNTINEE